jgi:hypothetical protein
MPDPNQRYRINSPRVVHQTLDGETVIIDFETGAYFSLDQTGAQTWQLIEAGRSQAVIESLLASRCSAAPAEIAAGLQRFLDDLLAESLVVPLAPGQAVPAAPAFALAGQPGDLAERGPFTPPALLKYTDMQDLLLLDPIHEVDEAGWPAPKPQPGA